jgi:type IV pilus assembly protein PilE
MFAMVLVGILAAIAIPSYNIHLMKGYRAAAQDHLMDIAQRQQSYFLDNRSYASGTTAEILAMLDTSTPMDVAARYNITFAVTAGPPPAFSVTATAKGEQLTDGNLSINNAGNKTPAEKW